MIKKNNTHVFLFMMAIIVVIIVAIMKTTLLSTLKYENYVIMKKIFSNEEITKIQGCIGNTSEIGECFIECQTIILDKIKEKLGVNYMHIGLARLSNNNNNDAQSFHRDIKPSWKFTGKYPNVYTIVCYFDDDAKLSMGNEIIHSNAGDVVVFNSTNLHKAMNIDIFDNAKQRRVVQYFHVFFDEMEQIMFYNNHSFCEHIDGTEIMKYMTYFVDVKFVFEYFNIGRFINTTNCNTLFMTNIKKNTHLTTIDGIDYYQYF